MFITPTVVGYFNNQNYTHGEMKLVTPCFANVGVGTQVSLKDITVSGYKDSTGKYIGDNEDGFYQAVEFAMLNKNGGTLKVDGINKIFYWNDTPDLPGGWYDRDDNPLTEDGGSLWGDAAEIIFTNGKGFRLYVNENFVDGDENLMPFTINFNGEVLKGDVEINNYTPGTMFAAGNPLPVPVKLNDMTVGGYLDKDGKYVGENEDGFYQAFEIAAINVNGGTLKVSGINKIFYWNDTVDLPAGWYDRDDNPMTADGGSLWGDAEKIEYKAADGFRVYANENFVDGDEKTINFTLKFPSCIK